MLFFLMTGFHFCYAQKADSLISVLNLEDILASPKADISDTASVIKLHDHVHELQYSDPEGAAKLSRYSYQIASRLQFKRGIAMSLRMIGSMKMTRNELDSGILYVQRALDYANEHHLRHEIMESYRARGNGYFYKGDYENTLEMYFKASEIADASFPEDAADKYGSIGLVFRVIGNNEKAMEYLQKGYDLATAYNDTSTLVFLLNNLGITAKNMEEYSISLGYYLEGLELAQLTGNVRREGEICYNLGNVYGHLGDQAKVLEMLERSTRVTEQIGNDRDIALQYHNLGHNYLLMDQPKRAEKYGLLALEYGKKVNYPELVMESNNLLAEVYDAMDKYRDAYVYRTIAYSIKDSLSHANASGAAIEVEKRFELEKIALADSLYAVQRDLELEHVKKLDEEKIKSRESLLWISGGIILVVFMALFMLFMMLRKLSQKNKIITSSNEQILLQKLEIEEQHKEITDSINYAQRIQSALLVGDEEWAKISPQLFILFRPKDVVSGDFYWAYHDEENNTSIWAVGDCTGHGVPGAFMSMLGIGFLNEIVIENGNRKGSEILNQLREKIIRALEQKNTDQQQKDGMDLALCVLDHQANTLEFTGANNPLWVIRNGQVEETDNIKVETTENNSMSLLEFRANKMPVGLYAEQMKSFNSQRIHLQSGDTIVAFTDGFADQFGGPKGKKYKYRPFKHLLMKLQTSPLSDQASKLSSELDSWMGGLEQVDDVCVIGVRV